MVRRRCLLRVRARLRGGLGLADGIGRWFRGCSLRGWLNSRGCCGRSWLFRHCSICLRHGRRACRRIGLGPIGGVGHAAPARIGHIGACGCPQRHAPVLRRPAVGHLLGQQGAAFGCLGVRCRRGRLRAGSRRVPARWSRRQWVKPLAACGVAVLPAPAAHWPLPRGAEQEVPARPKAPEFRQRLCRLRAVVLIGIGRGIRIRVRLVPGIAGFSGTVPVCGFRLRGLLDWRLQGWRLLGRHRHRAGCGAWRDGAAGGCGCICGAAGAGAWLAGFCGAATGRDACGAAAGNCCSARGTTWGPGAACAGADGVGGAAGSRHESDAAEVGTVWAGAAAAGSSAEWAGDCLAAPWRRCAAAASARVRRADYQFELLGLAQRSPSELRRRRA